MPKDFTDYVVMIHSAGDRVVDYKHVRITKSFDMPTFRWRDHTYDFNRDLGYVVKWAPWRKTMERSPKVRKEIWHVKGEGDLWAKIEVSVKKPRIFSMRPIATLYEYVRPKKVGLLLYQEPCTNQCSICQYNKEDQCPVPNKVEPMYISKIHQPSGEIGNPTTPFTPNSKQSVLMQRMTPFTLKMIVDSADKYRKTYKSYAFGLRTILSKRWWIIIIGAIIGIVVLLYLTGAINFTGR